MTANALLLATLYNRMSTLQEALETAGWNVLAYDDPRQALERLQGEALEAVFCDEYLRGASPAGLLAWSRRVAPGVPFYLFAMNEGSVRFSGAQGPDRVLRFPPRPADVPRPQQAPRAPALGDAEVPLQGDLALLPLESLLDMMGIARQSAVIVLDAEPGGHVVLENGVLRHVESTGGQLGVRALAELLRVQGGSFRVEPYSAPKRKTLNIPAATGLTEAAKLLDEIERDRGLVDAAHEACPSAHGIASGYPLSPTPSYGVGDMTQAFTAGRRLLEATRGAVSKLSHLCVEGEDGSVAVVVYGDGNLLAAHGPTGQSLRLLAGLSRAVRGLPQG